MLCMFIAYRNIEKESMHHIVDTQYREGEREGGEREKAILCFVELMRLQVRDEIQMLTFAHYSRLYYVSFHHSFTSKQRSFELVRL
jgi:hypothetical protein